jgi:GAF domain-containing protein
MSNEPRTTAAEFEQDSFRGIQPSSQDRGLVQEEGRRAHMFRLTGWLLLGIGVIFLVLFGVLAVLVPTFPFQYLIPGAALFILVAGASLWLGRRGHLSWAASILTLGLLLALLGIVYFANGVGGPAVVLLTLLPVVTGLMAGPAAARHIALTTALLFLAMAVLEWWGILRPGEMSPQTVSLVSVIMLVITITIATLVTGAFVSLAQRALSTAQQRGEELAEASRQAEQAVLAERVAREQGERTAEQLRQAVREFVAFLERVSAGDYSARLQVGTGDEGSIARDELLALRQQLNATVETLVAALSDLQTVQQRYMQQAWEGFTATGTTRREFRYADTDVQLVEEAWLAPMTKAVEQQSAITDERELAIPITLRGEVIGAVGAHREESASWDEADIALVEAITDQLAQTMESLRLLDETQRHASRERLTREITDRMRRALDIDDLIQITIQEMSAVLGTSGAFVQLGPSSAEQGID